MPKYFVPSLHTSQSEMVVVVDKASGAAASNHKQPDKSEGGMSDTTASRSSPGDANGNGNGNSGGGEGLVLSPSMAALQVGMITWVRATC